MSRPILADNTLPEMVRAYAFDCVRCDSRRRRRRRRRRHHHHHHHHHLFAQYAEINSKICNVPDRKANSFSSDN